MQGQRSVKRQQPARRWIYVVFDQGVGESVKKRASWQLPPISLEVSSVERQFSETEEAKRMIVHEQLKAMERLV